MENASRVSASFRDACKIHPDPPLKKEGADESRSVKGRVRMKNHTEQFDCALFLDIGFHPS